MSRLPERYPEKPGFAILVPGALLLLLLTGCVARQSPGVTTPPESNPQRDTEPAVPSARGADEALFSARAHQAAGERALAEGDSATAKREYEAALAVLAGAGDDPRVAEVASDIGDELKALETATSGAPEQPEAEDVEPSPLDELGTTTPQLTPGQIEQERSLIDFAGLKFDIPFVVNDRVIAWVDFYSNRNREKFLPGLVRSGRYLPMIQRIFEEEGLPKDLSYMAHVESAYKVNAYSRARAKGIFQFISGTGRRYGLRIDSWVDERSDPEKATRAATAYLKDLYAMFGDWYLALAAYNAGEGKIQRAIDRTGQRDFWALSSTRLLRNETVNYVPAILAATLISKDPKRFGLEFEPDPPAEYETIRVDGPVHLKVLARCAGTDFETLQTLNPALRRRQTPPGSTEVRVPPGTGSATLTALAEIPAADRAIIARHVVEKGDTLGKIAKQYGVRASAIQKANHMGRRTTLRPGESLVVPGGTAEVADASGGPRPVRSEGATIYRVHRGDTLSSVARHFGTTPAAIASLSGIPVNGVLDVGQRLTIPGTAQVAASARPAHPAGNAHEKTRVVHTVRRGETLLRIAERYQVTVDRICALNDLRPGQTIYPGLRLTIQ